MAQKSNKMTARGWHTWTSIILMVPIFIVGATAVFIAHDKALGTEKVPVSAAWMPGYSMATPEPTQVRHWLMGTPHGDLSPPRWAYHLGARPVTGQRPARRGIPPARPG